MQPPNINPVNQPPAAPPKTGVNKGVFGLVIVILVIVIAIGAYLLFKPSNKVPVASTVNVPVGGVNITKTGFVPTEITTNVGEAVVWTNTDTSSHQIASDPYPTDNELSALNESKPLLHGQSYSYVFNKAGTYTYHDNLNPYTLKGTVIVK